MAPLTLLSLNHDVLLEILKLLLLDTPPSPHRAAVLRACSLLHELGLPLLYRVVDLRGFRSRGVLVKHWEGLFGEAGLLTEDGRFEGLGTGVFGLRLGGEQKESDFPIQGFDVQPLDLPNCSSLLLDLETLYPQRSTVVAALLVQLPITSLSIDAVAHPDHSLCDTFGRELSLVIALPNQPTRWKDLRRITFCGSLWFDQDALSDEPPDPKISFSDWSFHVLVVELGPTMKDKQAKQALEVFLDLDSEWNHEEFLRSTERIEFRISGKFAGEFEKEFRGEAGKIVGRGLDAFESRVFGMMVFVGEDGRERKLIEEK